MVSIADQEQILAPWHTASKASNMSEESREVAEKLKKLPGKRKKP